MNKAVNELRLFLFTCSGEDNFILKKCSSKIQKRFALIGSFVLIIFTGCFFSATFFTYLLFEGAKWVSIPIGLMWGAVISNLYLLLLHTISPEIIPLSSKKKKQHRNSTNIFSVFTFSMCLRLVFMILLAIIIAQPLNVFICSNSVQNSIEKHKIIERVKLFTISNKELIKQELINQKEFNKKTVYQINEQLEPLAQNQIDLINNKINGDEKFIELSSKLIAKIDTVDQNLVLSQKETQKRIKLLAQLENLLNNELASDANFISDFESTSINGSLQKEYEKYRNNLIQLVTEKTENYNELNVLLNKSNFYVKTIQLLLFENPASWFITLLVCLAFLLPIYFKYNTRKLSSKLFNKNNNEEVIKLREELINTKHYEWLENKIKSIDINRINTSDYYFQRMLIEHRIILEEYDKTKIKFSEIMTSKIIRNNNQSLERLIPLLEKIKKINPIKYDYLLKQISEEYKDEILHKYEYWIDAPFRTKRHHTTAIKNNEQSLLDYLYKQE